MQLSESIENLLDLMQYEVYSVEESLRDHQKGHAIQDQAKECRLCGREYPALAQMCNHCDNFRLQSKICTSDSRISQYFVALRKVSIWPSLKPFRTLSAFEISSSIALLNTYLQPGCTGENSCPLFKELEILVRTVHDLLKQAAGLSLSDIQTL